MASSAQKFVYTIQAAYEGRGDLQALGADLKSIKQIDAVRKLETDWTATNKQFVEAKAKLRDLSSEMRKPGGEVFAKAVAEAKKEVTRLGESLEKQKSKLLDSRNNLKNAGIAAGDLAGTYDRLKKSSEEQGRVLAAQSRLGVRSHAAITEEANKLTAAYQHLVTAEKNGLITTRDLTSASNAYKKKLTELKTETNSWRESLDEVKSRAVEIAAVGAALVGSAMAGISFESAMADVRKVVDGTPEELAALGRELQEMSRTIPLTAVELAKIAASGGQLGIAAQDISAFVEVTAKMATAFDMTAEEAGNAIGKLKNVFGLSIQGISEFGDAINQLGNTSAAREKDIVDVMLRIGGTSQQFGLAKEQTAALAAAMLSLGKTPETASTAINALLNKMQTATMQSNTFQEALDKIGMSADDMAAMVAKNPQQALTGLLETLAKLDGQNRAEVLTGLFGTEFQDDIGVLVGGLQTYRDTLQEVGDKNSYAGAMLLEFKTRAATAGNQLILLKNAVVEIATNVGTGLLPVIKTTAAVLTALLQPIASLTGEFPRLTAAIATFATGALVFGSVTKMVGIARLAFSSFGLTAITSLGGIPALIQLVNIKAIQMAGVLTTVGGAINGVTSLLGKMSLIGLAAFAGWKIGEFLNNFNIVKTTMLSIIHTADLVQLNIKKMWRQITGGDVGQIEREIAVSKSAYGELLSEIEAGGKRTTDSSKQAQKKITTEVEAETAKQVDAVNTATDEMAKAYEELDLTGKEVVRPDQPDEFGLSKNERDNIAAELAKLDGQKKSPTGGMNNQIVKDNGVWTNYAAEILNQRRQLPSLPAVPDGLQAGSKASAKPDKIHELRFAGGKVSGSGSDVENLLGLLEQAGMSAA
jgi:TP901 family phage tail tape measure protein